MKSVSILACGLISVMALGPGVGTLDQNIEIYWCGKIDGDHRFTPADGFHLMNWFAGGPEPWDMRGADINGDCTWTTGDAFQYMNWLGWTGSLDCELCWPGCAN
jgi:hypothetical protein